MKVFNIQPVLFQQYYLWFKFCEQEFLFSSVFKFAILVSRFTRKDNRFVLHIYIYTYIHTHTFHFLRLKQKMDSLLFLIKKHNYKKTLGCNDKLSFII